MKCIYLILPFLLTGCYKGYYTQADIDTAVKLCEPNGGISELWGVGSMKQMEVTALVCKNGAKFPLEKFASEE